MNITDQLDIQITGNALNIGGFSGRQISQQVVKAMKQTSAYMSNNPEYGFTTRVWVGGVNVFAPAEPISGGSIDQVASELEALGFMVERDGNKLSLAKSEWLAN